MLLISSNKVLYLSVNCSCISPSLQHHCSVFLQSLRPVFSHEMSPAHHTMNTEQSLLLRQIRITQNLICTRLDLIHLSCCMCQTRLLVIWRHHGPGPLLQAGQEGDGDSCDHQQPSHRADSNKVILDAFIKITNILIYLKTRRRGREWNI